MVRQQNMHMLLFLVAILICLWVPDWINSWATNWEPPINFATFFVACLVLRSEWRDAWKNSLPCKLSVVFNYGGELAMACRYADLVAISDARNLAQQIGMQMNNGVNLKFNPAKIRPEPIQIERDQDGAWFQHIQICYQLTQLDVGSDPTNKLQAAFDTGNYWLFNNESATVSIERRVASTQ
jgi:hypothetical protein